MKLNINRDIVYIVSFVLILVNLVLINKDEKRMPLYTKSPIFHLIYMICLVVSLKKNIYIGFFVGLTYLNIIRK